MSFQLFKAESIKTVSDTFSSAQLTDSADPRVTAAGAGFC